MDKPTKEQVHAARRAAGLTQEQAAAVVHRRRERWAAWETGERHMMPDTFELFLLKTHQKELPRKRQP